MRIMIGLACLSLLACAKDSPAPPSGGADLAVAADLAATPDLTAAPDLAPACEIMSLSPLAGVRIGFPANVACRFTLAEAAAGIQIPYQVVVDAPVTDVEPRPLDAGGCGRPGPSGLIVQEVVEGGGQRYCVCDQGRCAPFDETVTLPAGTHPATFSWDGRNWNGPSDTGQPKGAPFPAGRYTLSLHASGTRANAAFDIVTTLAIELVP